MKDIASFIALNRFGLGAAPGDAGRMAGNPRGWLRSQIKRRPPLPRALARFRDSDSIMTEIHRARRTGPKALETTLDAAYRRYSTPEIATRTQVMIGSNTPFVERMVMFWSNHFSVSSSNRIVGPAIPAYEREAIRPHVFGRFSDMLKAVCSHSCMISYLGNTGSIGPQSRAGRQGDRAAQDQSPLNETLARTILKRHTLGSEAGFTAQDVTGLAQALSGWSHGGLRPDGDTRSVHGRFEFKHDFHQPGPKQVLGRTYAENGLQEGVALLDMLAHHPATARTIATKLVRHFVHDDPPSGAVDRIAAVFQRTEGDLAAVAAALIDLEEVWENAIPKVKTHYELVIATFRATGRTRPRAQEVMEPLHLFGQVPFTAPSPAGWSDRSADWIGPEALMQRIEWLRGLASGLPATLYPETVLRNTIGPVAQQATRDWIDQAPSGDRAIAMILASPEFQRR